MNPLSWETYKTQARLNAEPPSLYECKKILFYENIVILRVIIIMLF